MTEEHKLFVKQSIDGVRRRISEASTGEHGEVILLAATKTVDAETINYAVNELGLTHIGENKVQELVEKYPRLDKEKVHIHFIGHLQTNKVKQIIDKVELIHSLDSISLAKEIGKRASAIGKVMQVLVEINIAEEESKGGINPKGTENFIREASQIKGIRIMGLMTMAPAGSTDEEYRRYFTETREIFREMSEKNIHDTEMRYLSMGMSGSYEEAVRCGSNIVRVGSAIFGRRNYL